MTIFLQPNKMGHDVSTGIIEFIMDHFTQENEGTFTCQITDGGGKAQSSLVLIGKGNRGHVSTLPLILVLEGHSPVCFPAFPELTASEPCMGRGHG